MTSKEIIAKIAAIDAQLSQNRFEGNLTPEQAAKLRNKRDRLERKLYR